MSLTTTLKSKLIARLGAHPRVLQLYRLLRGRTIPLHDELKRGLRGLRNIYFVQVGSNDGTQGDPIHRLVRGNPRWSGIFIEPVPFLFERLKANYSNDPRFRFENVAIGQIQGFAPFYYVSERAKDELGDALPYWYDQLGSFDRNHIVKHLNGLLEPYIVEMQLPCHPIQDILDRNGVSKIDLLHIDTEGYDYHVLSQFDFARYMPRVVLYEHKHLNAHDNSQARQLMQRHGYQLHQWVDDTVAICIKR